MSEFSSNEKEAASQTDAIGPCLVRLLGFTCSLRSDHDGNHESVGRYGDTASWMRGFNTNAVIDGKKELFHDEP